MLGIGAFKQRMVQPDKALPGRATPLRVEPVHFVTGRPIVGPFAEGLARVQFGMGCFWGAERKFWSIPGVVATAVGYSGGYTPNPSYEEVCSGQTGHTESVLVVYDPAVVGLEALLKVFWENHDPTQGMRQGNDTGTQYRSAVYVDDDAQLAAVEASREAFQARLAEAGYGAITTEIRRDVPFFYAETYHQQYLAKNPNGYCGLGGTGVSCPIGTAA
ncbi:peptide-methionine (S)-S-oxide reductase MsrA [Coralloluteibacterium stylophorae]|uniref:Peptide methionine sulfoxide reductase MsrA n=1 Tax=Coralloluteibacterium stylophorae TaxID=1776034 RepID=A0A8J8AX08_9GAMM|nr:peptide-methionine (S)-S-oxide reductase MsrA [Coralloluteibacterium stylophorae]MBS7456132.1 peptide-methionine (S)-S-oxide reductase MsrA [Coralloluteibacterium stylophorae]